MNQHTVNGILITYPTREDVESLQVGDFAPDCFGKMSKVVKITYRGTNVHGKAYVGFYTEFGDNKSSMSGSLVEDEVVSTVPLARVYRQAHLAPKP